MDNGSKSDDWRKRELAKARMRKYRRKKHQEPLTNDEIRKIQIEQDKIKELKETPRERSRRYREEKRRKRLANVLQTVGHLIKKSLIPLQSEPPVKSEKNVNVCKDETEIETGGEPSIINRLVFDQDSEDENISNVSPEKPFTKELKNERVIQGENNKSSDNVENDLACTLDESKEDKLSVVCPKCKAQVEIHSPLFFVKPKEDEMLYIVAKVYHYLDQEYEDLKKAYADLSFPPLANILRRAALATGVTEERVVEILEKEKNAHVMCHPPKRRKVQSQRDNILPCDEGSFMNNEVDDEPSLNEPELTIEETVVVKMESQEVECVETAYNRTMEKQPDEPEEFTNEPLPSMSEPKEVQDAVASTLATPFAQPIIAAYKSKAQKQREYRQRIAASRTPAQAAAARKSKNERQHKNRLRQAANLAIASAAEPITAAPKTRAQIQREYRQRIAASKTPAQAAAAREARNVRDRNNRSCQAGSLEATTTSSSRSGQRLNTVHIDTQRQFFRPGLTIEETVVVKKESLDVECDNTANTIQPIETVDVKQEPRDHDHNYTTKTLDQSSLGLNDSSNLTQKGIYNRTTTEIVIPRSQYALGFEPPPLVKMVPRPRNIQYDNISGPAPQVEPPPLVRLETRSRNIDYDTSLPPLGVEPPPLVQLNYDNTANRVSIETVDVKQEPRDHDYNNTFGTTTHQIGDITVETDGYLNTLNSALYVPSSTEKKAAEYSRSYRQRHRDEINERRRERRQRLKELEKISNTQNSEQINTTTSDNQDSLKKHTQRQQRYYERHREEINKRKREKRRKHVSPSAPATPAERNRKYRERKKQEINERRRYSRIRQKYEQLKNRQANREESTSAFPSSDADDRIDQIFLEADPLRDREIKEEEIEIHEEGLR